jgi:hypothetical protein
MALNLPRTISQDERFRAWVRIAGRIQREHVWQGWNHKVFRLMRAVFESNDRLSDDGGFLYEWMARNYLDSTLMLLRRELDLAAGTENIRNLLIDIAENPAVLCRSRYREQYPSDTCFDVETIDRIFDEVGPLQVQDNRNDDHVDPAIVRADLERIVGDAERIRVYAERTRAHRTPTPQGDPPTVTIEEMHQTIADIRRVIGKYYALLTLHVAVSWEPVAQFDMLKALQTQWVSNVALAEIKSSLEPGE